MARALNAALGLFVYGSTILVALALIAGLWGINEFTKSGPLTEPALLQIERGDGLLVISHKLKRAGALDDVQIFNIAGKALGAQRDLKAGEYELPAGISARDILNLIREGKTFQRRFTVREGLTSYEIVQLINAVPELSGGLTEIPAEGTLLPETYDYHNGKDRADVVERLEHAMTDTIEELWPARAEGLPIKTPEEAIILASIVEKETAVADERKRVAGVFINRLRRGIALQTDPTVIYAITKGKHQNEGKGPLGRRLRKTDLEFDSPYNTYKYPGLPPGPIANPGRASIEAVLNPEEHGFIYFVADGTGGHAFSKTLDEHNRNVAKWRKIRRTQAK